MIEVKFSSSFERAFKKWKKHHPELLETFLERFVTFCANPNHPQFKTHKLSGNLKDFWSFSINYSYRVVFYYLSESQVLFEDIGTHDEVY